MDLTILIPTRNRNSIVAECVYALEHSGAEIIVIDDASDQLVRIQSNGVHTIRHDRQRGRGACINSGMKAASHDAVLIIDDDIYAAPDMVVRLFDEFSAQNNSKLCVTSRLMWDPDLTLTMTMKWMEDVRKFRAPMLLSRSFVLENGGYDENFTRGLEDTELQLRLKQHGLEMRRLEAAVGFQHKTVRIRDLVEREFLEGVSAVFLHAKFPEFMPQVDDIDVLQKNEALAANAQAAIDEIALMEQSGPSVLPAGVPELYVHVCRHYFTHGIFEGLKDIGGMRPRRDNSCTLAIYRQASRLEDIQEFDEARRLFSLVLHRPDDEPYWDGAEYHLGCIETALGNPAAAYEHFKQCLRLNPTHDKARRALNRPIQYREVESNVFERIEPADRTSVLFVLFGDLGHVINAIPVVSALGKKFGCEPAWLTSAEYADLARASLTACVYEAKSPGVIPWDWIDAQGFTHVFFPEPSGNREEWERSGLSALDFIAGKCHVEPAKRQCRLEPGAAAHLEAEEFLLEHGLDRNAFITASHGDAEGRHWPNSNLMKLAQQIGLPIVVFGKKGCTEIPGTIACQEKPLEVMTVLIGWSSFYLGPVYGVSWLAATTDTPMAVFFDPQASNGRSAEVGSDIQQWDIYTNLHTVLDHIESRVFAEV